MFTTGFEKTAGLFQRLKDRVVGAFTDKDIVYHGTSSKRGAKILKEGIQPNQKRGISDLVGTADGRGTLSSLNKGKTFTTKDKDIAKIYAAQAEGLEKGRRFLAFARKNRKFIPDGKFKNGLNNVLKLRNRKIAVHGLSQIYSNLPFVPKGSVMKATLPKSYAAAKATTNPEIQQFGRKVRRMVEDVTKKQLRPGTFTDSIVKRISRYPFEHDVVLKGSVLPTYLKKVV